MNCEKFQTVVNDLVRDQMMEASERAGALAHVQECDACALNWEDERSLTAGLRTLAAEMKSIAAPPRIEANVLAAFRERANGVAQAKSVVIPMQPRRQLTRYWVAAVAALLLVVFGIFVVRARVQSRSPQETAGGGGSVPTPASNVKLPNNNQRSDTAKATDPQPVQVSSPRRNENLMQAGLKSTGVSRGKHTTGAEKAAAPAPAAKDEVATGFFPLTYGSAPNLQEGGQMVRVELSRDAVARFGLPVNLDRTGERVKADVLVGSDGLAQAIRFVH